MLVAVAPVVGVRVGGADVFVGGAVLVRVAGAVRVAVDETLVGVLSATVDVAVPVTVGGTVSVADGAGVGSPMAIAIAFCTPGSAAATTAAELLIALGVSPKTWPGAATTAS